MSNISSMKVKVEFLPGTSINKAVKDSMDFMMKNSIAGVTFNFNGIDCSVGRGTILDNVDETWNYAMTNKKPYCFF